MTWRTIRLPHAVVDLHPHGAVTHFPVDGSYVEATPWWDDEGYHKQAVDLGYGNDLLAMCQDHELLHSAAAEMLYQKPSEALWRWAHGDRSKKGLGAEEDLVLRLQRELKRT
jgi:hypothetical protein